MKKINLSLFCSALTVMSVLSSCGNSGNKNTARQDSTTIDAGGSAASAQNIFVSIPSPIETASLLKQAGAKYNGALLNGPENASRYSTTASQALNMGVYGADFAFAGIFDQHAETMLYVDCTRKLADDMHVSAAFSDDRITRLQNNMNSRDSVLGIVTDAYWDCDALLNDNHQEYASRLMLAGGWIEGLYLACKVAEETNSNEIRIRIVEQRYSLDKLLSMLQKDDNADIKSIYNDLQGLKKLYDQLPKSSSASPSVSTNNQSGVTTIGGDSAAVPISLNELEFKEILDKVSAIRNGITGRN